MSGRECFTMPLLTDPLVQQFSGLSTTDGYHSKQRSKGNGLALSYRSNQQTSGVHLLPPASDLADGQESGKESDWFVQRYIDSLPDVPHDQSTRSLTQRGANHPISPTDSVITSPQHDGEDNTSRRRDRQARRSPRSPPLEPANPKKILRSCMNPPHGTSSSSELPYLHDGPSNMYETQLRRSFRNDQELNEGNTASRTLVNSLSQYIPSSSIILPPLTTSGRSENGSHFLPPISKTGSLFSQQSVENTAQRQMDSKMIPDTNKNKNPSTDANLPDSSVSSTDNYIKDKEEKLYCLFSLENPNNSTVDDLIISQVEYSTESPVDDSNHKRSSSETSAPAAVASKKRVTWSKSLPRRAGYATCSFHPSDFATPAPRLTKLDIGIGRERHLKRRRACCLRNDPALGLVHLVMSNQNQPSSPSNNRASISISIFNTPERK